ncbi:hypothetical protein M569_12131, partial [Genlisea aurea]
KQKKPRWLTFLSVLTKSMALIVVISGFVQIMRLMVTGRDMEYHSSVNNSGNLDAKFSEMQKMVKTSLMAIQVQMDLVREKVDDGVISMRNELNEQIQKGNEIHSKVKALDSRIDTYEKFMDDIKASDLLSKEEFTALFEAFQRSKGKEIDDIIQYARDIVMREIEKHSADGLGMVDYALASGGARVVKHSDPFNQKNGGWLIGKASSSAEKMLKPSFGEPGECFPLKGPTGFVVIRLRTAIRPEAVTLEHVSKSVAYDVSSAPKFCRVSGWLQGEGVSDEGNDDREVHRLAEFAYDVDKTNVQTFKVNPLPSGTAVDTVRLDVVSNHGNPSHTCVYRFRVHG